MYKYYVLKVSKVKLVIMQKIILLYNWIFNSDAFMCKQHFTAAVGKGTNGVKSIYFRSD